MKAAVYTKYGPPGVLEIKDVAKPVPAAGEVLVRVAASSINYNNLALVMGKPFLARLAGGGLMKPKYNIPGSDLAGVVEAAGSGVTRFKPGDEVFGMLSRGAFAEYACVPEGVLAMKPANISFAEAGAVPESALVALQGLRDKGHINACQKVLIYGASGGNGTFALQIARSYGAEVTGVCSARNVDMVSSLGAGRVIDYTGEDFTKNGEQYDLILATAGYRSIFDYRRALNRGGAYVMTGGSMSGPHAMAQVYQALLLGPWLSMRGGKKMGVLTLKPNAPDLEFITGLIEAGKVKPVIDRRYKLSEIAEALKYYEQGHSRGKVVITMQPA